MLHIFLHLKWPRSISVPRFFQHFWPEITAFFSVPALPGGFAAALLMGSARARCASAAKTLLLISVACDFDGFVPPME